jgi:hypothetical protein
MRSSLPNTALNSGNSGTPARSLAAAAARFLEIRTLAENADIRLLDCRARLSGAEAVYELVKATAIHNQTQCQARISSIVTRCLESVFPDNRYTFSLVFEQKRNQTEARCILKDKHGNEFDPLTENGGGLVDIVTFGLRVACLILTRPRPDKILILDEPFRFLSWQYREPVARLLQQLSEELQLQIIMVTHIPELEIGNNICI